MEQGFIESVSNNIENRKATLFILKDEFDDNGLVQNPCKPGQLGNSR